MTQKVTPTVILLAKAPLKASVGAVVTQFIYKNSWEIRSHDQWVDHKKQSYFVRLEWDFPSGNVAPEDVRQAFEAEVALPHEMNWDMWFGQEPVRIADFVTKEMAHLYELLMHCITGLWNAEVALVISNHPDLEAETRRFGVAFHHTPVNVNNKAGSGLAVPDTGPQLEQRGQVAARQKLCNADHRRIAQTDPTNHHRPAG